MARRPMLELDELADEVWVLPPSHGSGLHDAFTAACTSAGFTPVVQHEAEAAAARELIVAGAAIGLGQATFRSTPGIVPRPLRGTPLRLRHSLAWHLESALAAHGPAVLTAPKGPTPTPSATTRSTRPGSATTTAGACHTGPRGERDPQQRSSPPVS